MGAPNLALDHLAVERRFRQQDDEEITPLDSSPNLRDPVRADTHTAVNEHTMLGGFQSTLEVIGERRIVGLASFVGYKKFHGFSLTSAQLMVTQSNLYAHAPQRPVNAINSSIYRRLIRIRVEQNSP